MTTTHPVAIKVLARDIHYAPIEKRGLPDSPQQNAVAREVMLEKLAALQSSAPVEWVSDEREA